jgi:hypothetical protein
MLLERIMMSLDRATFTIAVNGTLETLTAGITETNTKEGPAITTRGMAKTTVNGVMVHITHVILDNSNTNPETLARMTLVGLDVVLFVTRKITL